MCQTASLGTVLLYDNVNGCREVPTTKISDHLHVTGIVALASGSRKAICTSAGLPRLARMIDRVELPKKRMIVIRSRIQRKHTAAIGKCSGSKQSTPTRRTAPSKSKSHKDGRASL